MPVQPLAQTPSVSVPCSCLPSKKTASALTTLVTLVVGSVLLGIGLIKLKGVAAIATYSSGAVFLGLSAVSFLYFVIISCKKNKAVAKPSKAKIAQEKAPAKVKQPDSPKTKNKKVKKAQSIDLPPPKISITEVKASTKEKPWRNNAFKPRKAPSPPPQDQAEEVSQTEPSGSRPTTPPESPETSKLNHQFKPIKIVSRSPQSKPGPSPRLKAEMKARKLEARIGREEYNFQLNLANLRSLMVLKTIESGQSTYDFATLQLIFQGCLRNLRSWKIQKPDAPQPSAEPTAEESSLTLYYRALNGI